MSTGVLNASATGNTVAYLQQGNQTVKTPSVSTYYNLVVSGTGTKTIGGSLIVDNDLSIESGSLDCGGNNIGIKGNWTNEGDFIESTGRVTFDGTSDQLIDNAAGEQFYDLTINKSSGNLILQSNVQTANTLSFAEGIVDAGILPVLGTPAGSSIDYVYRRRTDREARGLDYIVECSTTTMDYPPLQVKLRFTV